jgi:hypothetical protein
MLRCPSSGIASATFSLHVGKAGAAAGTACPPSMQQLAKSKLNTIKVFRMSMILHS